MALYIFLSQRAPQEGILGLMTGLLSYSELFNQYQTQPGSWKGSVQLTRGNTDLGWAAWPHWSLWAPPQWVWMDLLQLGGVGAG